MKLTEWFPANLKPTIPGVYQVDPGSTSGMEWYSYFDGEKFGWRDCRGPQEAAYCAKFKTDLPGTAAWRGLAEKP